jgi:hypothetical protein
MYSKVRKSQTRKVEEKEKLNSITGTTQRPTAVSLPYPSSGRHGRR